MISFIQIGETFNFGSGTSVITLSSTSNRSLGNRNVVLINWYVPNQSGGTPSSVVDTDGNSYTQLPSSPTIDGNFGVAAFECKSIKAGTGTNTVTITFSVAGVTGAYNGAGCSEYSGTDPSKASYGYGEQSSSSGGSIGVSLTPTTIGDVMVGWFGVTDASTTGQLNTLRGTIQATDSLWDEYTTTSLAAHSVGGVASDFGVVVGVVLPSASTGIPVPYWAT